MVVQTHRRGMSRHVVLDTNVWIAAFRSRRGASRVVIDAVLDGRLTMHLTVPLVAEYEATFTREHTHLGLSLAEVELLLDLICRIGHPHQVHYLWRWQVPDPRDAHVLEAALASAAPYLLTFNKRDLREAEDFGLQVLTPGEFLALIRPLT